MSDDSTPKAPTIVIPRLTMSAKTDMTNEEFHAYLAEATASDPVTCHGCEHVGYDGGACCGCGHHYLLRASQAMI